MATRQENREATFILLFEKSFEMESCEEIIELSQNIDDIKVNEKVKNKFLGVVEKTEEFNEIIAKFSDKRVVDRLPKVNLAILRLALFEMIYDDEVPLKVAINEAIVLAKKYAQIQDASFINGVLGSYADSLEEKND